MANCVVRCLMLAVMLLAVNARAVEIEGVKIDDKASIAANTPELILNGAGVRHKLAFLKIYIGSLYLTHKITESQTVFADVGAKRVSMNILANEVKASDLIASLNNALAANLLPNELALIEKRVRDLNAMLSNVKMLNKGAVVYIDYLPGTGTRITINGEEKITIAGDDFFRALLHIWLGNKPVDGRLRDAMLGTPGRFF